ncbi:MAG TPA: NUDIX hydrolase [Bryobacteraceae bacterium]|nr:NUDIX hydrolase [Bryobacteraceae bacterium]
MKLISSEERYRSSIFSVTEDCAVDPDGFEIKRAIVRHGGSAVVMPIDEKGRILLVRQYRLPARQFLWEIPAGRVDEGETVRQAAKRELQEETGIRSAKLTKLASFYVSPGFLEEKMTIFVAQGLKTGEATPMEDERIEMRWYSARELDRMIAAGEIMDAKTIIGFLAWKRYGAAGSPRSR